jgi:signal transduction histidine kinase
MSASSISVAFAARDWRTATGTARGSLLLLCAAAAVTAGASIWAVAQAGSPVEAAQLSPLRTAARIGIATIVGGFLVGAARDLVPPARAAWAFARADAPAGARLWTFLSAFVDELFPARVAGRRVVAESERARLAADLHALVLPDLRRAAESAEAAGMPHEVQLDLRRALEDVEQLMHERQSIVLEQFGLVAALEWLAERTEERSRLRVQIELDGDVPDRRDAVEPAVARAAFRIALLALDNVVRHAGATTATIRLSTAGKALRLSMTDDGTASSEGEGKAGRGIADMRAAAASTGGSMEISAEPGHGTRVIVTWPISRAASNHATGAEDATDRSGTPAR